MSEERRIIGFNVIDGVEKPARGYLWFKRQARFYTRDQITDDRIWNLGQGEEELRKNLISWAERHIFGDTGCSKFFFRLNFEDRNLTLDLMEEVHQARLNMIFDVGEDGIYRLGDFHDKEQEQLMKERIFAGAKWILSQPCQDAVQHEVDNNTMTKAQGIQILKQYVVSQENPVPMDTNCDLNIPVILVETETLEEKGLRNFIVPGTFPEGSFFIKRVNVLDFNDWTATYQIFTDNAPGDGTASLPAVEGLPNSDVYILPSQYLIITVTDTAGNTATKRIDYPAEEE